MISQWYADNDPALVTMALGDALNDATMLHAVDRGRAGGPPRRQPRPGGYAGADQGTVSRPQGLEQGRAGGPYRGGSVSNPAANVLRLLLEANGPRLGPGNGRPVGLQPGGRGQGRSPRCGDQGFVIEARSQGRIQPCLRAPWPQRPPGWRPRLPLGCPGQPPCLSGRDRLHQPGGPPPGRGRGRARRLHQPPNFRPPDGAAWIGPGARPRAPA